MYALEQVNYQVSENEKKTILDFAKGHRFSSSVALEVWKRNLDKNFCSLRSLWSDTQGHLGHSYDLKEGLNITLEESYLVEWISEGEGLYFCMKWVISKYIHYLKSAESYLFPCIIYIDTCASLSIAKWSDWMKRQGLNVESIQQFWNKFFYNYRVVDAYEFIALLKSLHSCFQQRTSSNWIIVDNFTYQLEPFECRGNLPYLFLNECYQLTKLYNTLTFLVTNISCSNQEMISPLERYSFLFDIRLWIPESPPYALQNRFKVIKSPYSTYSFIHSQESNHTTLLE
ncbi:hypothetical protein GpartN1_g5330.t1 [Galdieria partita]|uniref:Uncharacterized protein n=1 Tax=Galdieria partita TaxID=83374 RepID=A0A9C7URZ2_9RHOD|nr:hypothetical protein GpartN1_g5330.t1 [Galdieria partita]